MKWFSIITNNREQCFICGSHRWIEIHHVFGAYNRKKSTEYGLVVPLCHYCHNEPPNGVHHNADNNRKLRRIGQKAFQKHYPDLDFRQIFGKNYL